MLYFDIFIYPQGVLSLLKKNPPLLTVPVLPFPIFEDLNKSCDTSLKLCLKVDKHESTCFFDLIDFESFYC